MSLAKTSVLNGLAVAVKIASAIVLNKVLAIYVGPAGYGLVGQFQNAVSVVINIAGGLVVSGVTKSTAEHFDDECKQRAIWQTAIRFSLWSSLVAGIGILLFRELLSTWLLSRADMAGVFVCLALALPAMVVNTLLLAVINGKKEILTYVLANIIGSLIVMLMTGVLAYNFGLYGALIAFAINPALAVVSTVILASRLKWFNISSFSGSMNIDAARELAGFGLMGLTTALIMPLTYMLIREHIASKLGVAFAGYWQATWKISEIYLMLITTTLMLYYLPRLAEIRDSISLKQEIASVYRFVMPIVAIGALSIYLLRDFIIAMLFSAEFSPMRDLFGWQMVGDVIKTGSFVLAYIMLGRAMTKLYIATEIIFGLFFVALNYIFVNKFGLVGAAMAYAINYGIYWVFMIFVIRMEISKMSVTSKEAAV